MGRSRLGCLDGMESGWRVMDLGGGFSFNMGVSKNKSTPKWMVKIMENPVKMDDLGLPLFLETSICFYFHPDPWGKNQF